MSHFIHYYYNKKFNMDALSVQPVDKEFKFSSHYIKISIYKLCKQISGEGFIYFCYCISQYCFK